MFHCSAYSNDMCVIGIVTSDSYLELEFDHFMMIIECFLK